MCWINGVKEFLADDYARCGEGQACICKRYKRPEGEKKLKEGHNKKACRKIENDDWENPLNDPTCCQA